MSRRTLLERVAAGDADAVEGVVHRYGDLVWSLVRQFVASEADAEEAVHDIFVAIWRKAAQYDPAIGAEVTFVSIIARRSLIDRWRQRSRRPPHRAIGSNDESPDPAADPARLNGDASAAASAFSSLNNDQRLVLKLSIAHGYTHSEIAEITGFPLGTVKTHARRGLARIRERLDAGPVETKVSE